MIDLTTQFVGLNLKSPILVGSAGITGTVELMKRCQDAGAAAVIVKSLFEQEVCRVAPTPRYHVFRHDLERRGTFTFYCYEQASEWGPERYAEEISLAKKELDIPIIASIDCFHQESWPIYAKIVEQAGCDALEINVSCPHGSVTFRGQDVETQIADALRSIRAAVKVPIIAKLSPQLTNPLQLVKQIETLGIEGVTIFNRITGLQIDLDTEETVMHGSYAGHGGPWVIQYPLRWISAMSPQTKMDINGSGGVSTPEDIVKYLLAGAKVVQVVTGVYFKGFEFLEELTQGLTRFMEQKGYTRLSDFRGNVCSKILGTDTVDRRHQYKAEKPRIGDPPCKAACPVGKQVQAFLWHISRSEFLEAYRLFRAKDPFTSLCGRVCYHPCETACTRSLCDHPLAIMRLERFAADYAKAQGQEDLDLEKAPPLNHRVAVVGAGPAGLVAAHDLARLGYDVTVFETLPIPGGMLAVGIPSYRLPKDVLEDAMKQITKLGMEIVTNQTLGRDFTLDQLKEQGFQTILVAVGAHQAQKLNVPGEDSPGVLDGITFLRELNLTNKAPYPIAGQSVTVIGGGSTAFDVARSCVRLGATEVYLVYRRTKEEMPAHEDEIHAAEMEGVRVLYLTAPVEVLADNKGINGLKCMNLFLEAPRTALRIADCGLRNTDAGNDKRRTPVEVEGTDFILKTNVVVAAVSQSPDLSFWKEKAKKKLIEVEEGTFRTNVPGVYAAGEVMVGPASVIEAIAMGKQAAASIHADLHPELGTWNLELGTSQSAIRNPQSAIVVDRWAVLQRGFTQQFRAELPSLELDRRKTSFDEVDLPLTPEQAIAEASRCLACGCGLGCGACARSCFYDAYDWQDGEPVILREKCDGCGMCVEVCPHRLIDMVKCEEFEPRIH